jgi:hypothetical protein
MWAQLRAVFIAGYNIHWRKVVNSLKSKKVGVAHFETNSYPMALPAANRPGNAQLLIV